MHSKSRTRYALLTVTAVAMLVTLAGTLFAAGQTTIKLFNGTPVSNSGVITSPEQAISFDEVALTLNCPAEPTGILSGTADGTGGVVVDNFLTVNGTNVCPGGGNCFRFFFGTVGQPAESVYGAVGPLDISAELASGRSLLTVELKDFGGVLGSSDVYLVTNCVIAERVDVCHKPGTSSQRTIEVAQSAVRGHLSHGDTLGACPAP